MSKKQHGQQQNTFLKMQGNESNNKQHGQQHNFCLKMQCTESSSKHILGQQQSFSKTLTQNGRRIRHGQNEGF